MYTQTAQNHSLSWLGTGTSIKGGGGVKLVFWTQIVYHILANHIHNHS